MRVLVTADIHLSEDHPERRDALADILRRAGRENVDYVLIAGDIFDSGVDIDQIKYRIGGLFSGNGFETFVIPGNHDANAFRGEDYFGDDIQILTRRPFHRIDLDGVNLFAVPFQEVSFGDIVGNIYEAQEGGRMSILLLHGTLSTVKGEVFGEESRYLPFTPEQLLETGVEYVFSGHIHSSLTRRSFGEGECVFAYPGSPVSITRRETGQRCVWLFDTETEKFEQRKVESFLYINESLDLVPRDGPEAIERLRDRFDGRDLSEAAVVVEPEGFIEMDEEEFFRQLTDIVNAVDPYTFEIIREKVESAKRLLKTGLYQRFEQALEDEEGIDKQSVCRIALQALSAEERR